jgi:putative protease
VAAVTRVYRAALDAWRDEPKNYQSDPRWQRELEAVSHRPYGTGFLFGQDDAFVNTVDSHYLRDCDFVGLVKEQAASGDWLVEGRNRFQAGDLIELIGPEMRQSELTFTEAANKAGEVITTVQPNALVWMTLPDGTQPGDFLRRWR